MFATSLYEKIVKACGEVDFYRDIPNIDDLQTLVEAAFWTSLKQEEGRSLTFSIALLSKDDLAKQRDSVREQILIRFDNSLPLSVETISKLAGAFDPGRTALIASRADANKDEFEIWGVLFFLPRINRFDEVPVAVLGLSDQYRPPVLMVTAVSTGSLLISWRDSQVGRLVHGDFIVPTPTPFMTEALGGFIMTLAKTNETFDAHYPLYWHVYRDSIDYLLAEASRRSHGAAIVLLPHSTRENYEAYLTHKFRFHENFQMHSLLNRVLTAEKSDSDLLSTALNQRYSERLGLLAQLACIDGALILSSQLEVLSFGCTLSAPEWQKNVLIGPDGFDGGGDKFDASKLGTRHNSLINFVGSSPASVGFAISQDGPIRGFAKKDDDTILCWPDCRVSLFV